MAKQVILKDYYNIEIMPVTRGELILDSSGNQALHSDEFLATDTKPGLMSKEDKAKLIKMSAETYGNADTVDGKHASDFLPITGGTITNNLIIESGKDAKLIFNNTDDEGWSLIDFYNKGTYVGDLGVRGNASLCWKSYIILNSANYTNYINETNFPGLVGVRSVTINEDYLKVNTNGVETNLTIPYSKKSSYLTSSIPLNSNYTLNFYASGTKIGTDVGNAYNGSSNDYTLYSFPGISSTAVSNGIANIMNLRFQFYTSYFHDIFASPNTRYLWHRNVVKSVAKSWSRIVEEDSDDVSTVWNTTVIKANTLTTPRTIWGQSFDGSGNVQGCLNITEDNVDNYTQGIRINQISTSHISSIWLATTTSSGYNNGMWGISATNTGNFRIRGGATSANDFLNITQNGNVGIGTANPTERLSISGSINATANVFAENFMAGYGREGVYLAPTSLCWHNENHAYTKNIINFYSDGKIYIGGTNPSETLTVAGNVKANNFIGNIDWSYIQNPPDSLLANGNYVTLDSEQTITGLKTFECASNTVGVSLKLKNRGWAVNMSTAMDFYNGSMYTVPNARIETKMVGEGKAGGTLIFYTQGVHASTNPNPNGLIERFRIGDDGTAKLTGRFTITNSVWPQLICNSTSSDNQVNIRFDANSSNKGYVGYVAGQGTFLYNTTASKYLAINDKGQAHVSGTLISLDGHTHDYLPLSGGTLNGLLTINNTAGSAFDQKYISLTNNSTEGARIGIDTNLGLGLYAKGTIYLRPNSSFSSSTYGLVISSTSLTYNGQNIYHSGNLGLSTFGITATAAELNYCDGVTSNIQTQLNNKSAIRQYTGTWTEGSTSNGYWGNVIKLTTSTTSTIDTKVVFLVSSYYDATNNIPGNYAGILCFEMRGSSKSAITWARCRWLTRSRNYSGLIKATYALEDGTLVVRFYTYSKSWSEAVSIKRLTEHSWNGAGPFAWTTYEGSSTPKVSTIPTTETAITFDDATILNPCTPASHTHNEYLPLTGGTMTGDIIMSIGTGLSMKYTSNSSTGDSWLYPHGAPNYGIRYYEGTPDKMTISASGNNNTIAGADLCINGNGNGTVTIRGNTIYHTGNLPSISTSNDGSGNAVTSITASGHTITITKEKNFFTHLGNDNKASVWSWGTVSGTSGWNSTASDRGYRGQYGTNLDISGYSTWYHRFAMCTDGRVEYWHGINTKTLTKLGVIAWVSDITKSQVGLGNVQNTAFYRRGVFVNGGEWDMAGTNSNTAFTIYAPTTAGTSGQVLISSGGTPSWTNKSNLSVGSATTASYLTNFSAGTNTWGTLISNNGYTQILCWASPDTGGLVFADKNQQLSMQIDGDYYANEGKSLVLHTGNISSYKLTSIDCGIYTSSTSNKSGSNTSGLFRWGMFDCIDTNAGGLKMQFGATGANCSLQIIDKDWKKALLKLTAEGKLTILDTITALGFYESSDMRLKTFLSDIKIDFEKLRQIPKMYFTWKSDEKEMPDLHIGTSAQEVQKLFPELVGEVDGHLTVAYDKLSIIALKAVDDLYEMVSELRKQNIKLKSKVDKLERRVYYGKKY